jgi:cell division protease FtsH
MFEQGKKNSPCIIFIDEIDAVGRHRGAGLGGGNDEREQTLNQLLVEMDGFEANAGVIIIAATNRPDVLDPALLRPGRFDRQVTVSNPDIIGRDKILRVHIKKIKVSPKFDPRRIARSTPGFSGADLANLVNEAALLAARKNKRMVTLEDFESAKDKVMMGAERRSMVMTEEDKKITAYHEAGHALAHLHCSESDPMYKATIIPRGRALGMVVSMPENDRVHYRKDQLEARLITTVAARIAEELIFGKEKIGIGAMGDIQQVTSIARSMVTEYGFSEKLGRVRYTNNQEEVFLGHSVAQSKNVSEETAKLIDEETKKLVQDAEIKARKILVDNMDDLHKIAKGLLEYETLTGDEMKDLIKGIKPNRDDFDNDINPESTIKPSVPKTSNTASPQTN